MRKPRLWWHARSCIRTQRALVGACTLALVATRAMAQGPPSAGYRRPDARADGWMTANADSLGVDAKRLAALTQSVRAWPELGVHAILIERAGRLIYEEYFDGFDERWGQPLGRVSMSATQLHDVRSVTKSVVSALTGIALGAGAIRSLDQPVIEWFPEYPELNTAERRRVTLAHVLGMTSGLEWNENVPYNDPKNDEIRMTRDTQPLRYALSPPFVHAPGAEFNYNGGLTHVMGAVLERATRTPVEEYVRAKLFEPLGITEFEWLGDLAGLPAIASGLRLRARDVAKFGSLYLHRGQWKGKQILPADWSTCPRDGISAFACKALAPTAANSAMRTSGGTTATPRRRGRSRRARQLAMGSSGSSYCRGSTWSSPSSPAGTTTSRRAGRWARGSCAST